MEIDDGVAALRHIFESCPSLKAGDVTVGAIEDAPAIFYTFGKTTEVFVHRTYMQAAEECIAFVKMMPVSEHKLIRLNRKQRRVLAAKQKEKPS